MSDMISKHQVGRIILEAIEKWSDTAPASGDSDRLAVQRGDVLDDLICRFCYEAHGDLVSAESIRCTWEKHGHDQKFLHDLKHR